MRLGVRLVSAFAAVALLLCVVAVAGLVAIDRQGDASRRIATAGSLQADAGTATYRTADFNGWQTAYAFDIGRGVAGATADSGDSRRQFLASATAFREDLARLGGYALTARQRALLGRTSTAFDAFMQLDTTIIAEYRNGTQPRVPGRTTWSWAGRSPCTRP
ncbi:hypothetical protein JCM9957A_00100 [Kineosporia succinea]